MGVNRSIYEIWFRQKGIRKEATEEKITSKEMKRTEKREDRRGENDIKSPTTKESISLKSSLLLC